MTQQFVNSFMNGNRIKCRVISIEEAKNTISPEMKIQSDYDGEHNLEVLYWDDDYIRCKIIRDDDVTGGGHYIHWRTAQERGCYVCLLNPPQSKRATSLRMEDVVLDDEKKNLIRAAVSQVDNHDLIFTEWGFDEVFEKGTAIAVLMWGPPGTGKTIMAQAVANELGLTLEVIQSGEIWSSEPGEAERTIKTKFEEAARKKQLLLFDECDSLIADRNEVGMILAAQINALLTGLENFRGVVCFTTNRLGTMDPAFERRVSVKVEFPFPSQEQRLKIWRLLIPSKAPIDDDVSLEELSQVPIAGGNIKNVILNAARFAAFEKKKTIDHSCFTRAIEKEGQAIKDFEANILNDPRKRIVGSFGAPTSGMGMSAQSGLQLAIDKITERIERTTEREAATKPGNGQKVAPKARKPRKPATRKTTARKPAATEEK